MGDAYDPVRDLAILVFCAQSRRNSRQSVPELEDKALTRLTEKLSSAFPADPALQIDYFERRIRELLRDKRTADLIEFRKTFKRRL